MADERAAEAARWALAELDRKLDTVAGALAAVASSHTDLLAHVAEAEARRSHDAHEVSQRLEAIERQVLAGTPRDGTGADLDLGELRDQVARLAEGTERLDAQGEDRAAAVVDELSERLTLHTDTALAGALRIIDARLAALREAIDEASEPAPPSNTGGFEAGAVMGATQAAWNRLEHRLDAEFDDLGRQLQALVSLIEHVATTTEAAANRPVVTGEQIRRAASVMKESVVSAGRSRRERRGGPRGLSSG